MNLSMNGVRPYLNTYFNWWLSGWRDAWVMLPKPAFLQMHPDVFETLDGEKLSFIAHPESSGTWQSASPADRTPQGLLLAGDNVLLRELSLPYLSEQDIAAAVSMDVQVNSPFTQSDTHFGYSTHRLQSGALRIEIAIIHRDQLTQTQKPQRALFARGQYGAIPMQNRLEHTNNRTWYRSSLTLGLAALLVLVLIAWVISPILLLRAESMLNETVLAKLNAHSAPLIQKREELATLQQQLENILTFDNEHPNPLPILDQLTVQIPDSSRLSQLSLRKDQLTLDGVSENAISILSLLEKLPDLKEIRLGTSINRDPRTGGETFQILARVQPPSPNLNESKP